MKNDAERPMTSDELRRFEEDIVHGDESKRNPPRPDDERPPAPERGDGANLGRVPLNPD